MEDSKSTATTALNAEKVRERTRKGQIQYRVATLNDVENRHPKALQRRVAPPDKGISAPRTVARAW